MPGAARLRRRSITSSRSSPPPDITDAVAVWWAGDLSLADNAGVASWTDRVSSITVSPVTDNPTYQLFALNGQPAVLFDGTNDVFTTTNTVSTSADGCVVAVLATSEVDDQQAIWSSSDGSVLNRYITGSIGLNNLRVRQYNADTLDDVEGGSLPAINTLTAFEWSSNGSAYTLRINNTPETLSTVSGSNTGDWFSDVSGRDNFTIGGLDLNNAGPIFLLMNPDTYLGYLGVFDSPLSTDDRTALYNWISLTYGITF